MPESAAERRLERIEAQQVTMLESLAVIREQVIRTNGSVDDLLAEVGRVPAIEARAGRLPITDRLHNIESVVSPSAMQSAVIAALDSRRASTWTARQKVATMAGVLIGTAFTVLRFAGLGG